VLAAVGGSISSGFLRRNPPCRFFRHRSSVSTPFYIWIVISCSFTQSPPQAARVYGSDYRTYLRGNLPSANALRTDDVISPRVAGVPPVGRCRSSLFHEQTLILSGRSSARGLRASGIFEERLFHDWVTRCSTAPPCTSPDGRPARRCRVLEGFGVGRKSLAFSLRFLRIGYHHCQSSTTRTGVNVCLSGSRK